MARTPGQVRQAARDARGDSPPATEPMDDAPRTEELPSRDAPESAGPPRPARAPRAQSRSRSRGFRPPQVINDGAGFVLGLVGYALFINFVRGGRTQARAWLAAKFLNRPLGQAPSGATVTASTAPAPATGGGGTVTRSSTPAISPPTVVPIPYRPSPPGPVKVVTV